jgi:ABC-type lipoprotein release transport system permease subunit
MPGREKPRFRQLPRESGEQRTLKERFMPWSNYGYRHALKFRTQVLTVMLMSVLLCFFLGMSESTRLMFDRMSGRQIYSVYEGNLACPMSGLVPEKYVDVVSKIPGVKAVSPEVRQNTVILPDFVVTILGVVPEKFRAFKNPDIKPEIWETFLQNSNGVLIGRDLAQSIEKRYGRLENKYTIPFKIVGVFDFPLSLLNNMMIAHKDYFKAFLFKKENVTVINLLFDQTANPQAMCQVIEDRLRGHKTKLVCRPETTIWERALSGMAQFGKSVHWYALVVISILFCFSLAQTLRFLRKESLGDGLGATQSPFHFYTRLFILNAITASAGGVFLATLLFMARPSFTGFDIFNPPVMVNFSVAAKAFFCIAGTTLGANVCAMFLFHRHTNDPLTWKRQAAAAVLPLLLIIFSTNFLISYPFKLRKELLNGAEPGNMSICQAGTSMRIRQASNIPNTVLDVCQLTSMIKTVNGEKLYTPLVQIAANIEGRNIPTIGIDPATFFKIESKIRLVDGRLPEYPKEIIIGGNVGLKLNRDMALGDTLQIEAGLWKIVGRFEAGSYYDNFIITRISDLIEATGRETLQAVLLKLDDGGNSEALNSAIQRYYGMLLDELPDLPRLAISSELDQVAQMAASYKGLFFLNSGLILAALWAGLFLLKTRFGLFFGENHGGGALRAIIVLALALLIEVISFIVGRQLHFTLALTTFSLQPSVWAMGGSFLAILAFVFYHFFFMESWQRQTKRSW